MGRSDLTGEGEEKAIDPSPDLSLVANRSPLLCRSRWNWMAPTVEIMQRISPEFGA